jgi:microcystin-dependent protein
MSNPYIGEIRMFAGNFAPANWALCQGQQLPISQNETLYNLIGTTYGGDGVNTFNLPNLTSRVPFHQGSNAGNTLVIGQSAGEEQVLLTVQQIPQHTHSPLCNSTSSNSPKAAGNYWGTGGSAAFVAAASANANMNAGTVGQIGGSQPHDNRMPYVAVNFIISLFGIFPSQN